jgi:hypothetical protein
VRRGTTGTSMTVHRIPRHPCKHQWTPWHRAGIFDSTERRDCDRCKKIETRKPRVDPDLKKMKEEAGTTVKRTKEKEKKSPRGRNLIRVDPCPSPGRDGHSQSSE